METYRKLWQRRYVVVRNNSEKINKAYWEGGDRPSSLVHPIHVGTQNLLRRIYQEQPTAAVWAAQSVVVCRRVATFSSTSPQEHAEVSPRAKKTKLLIMTQTATPTARRRAAGSMGGNTDGRARDPFMVRRSVRASIRYRREQQQALATGTYQAR